MTLTFPLGLDDGDYALALFGANVTDDHGIPLDGDGDGLPGGDLSFEFHRLFGDSDGDRDVDFLDLFRFRTAFGTVAGNPDFNSAFDGDSDADVDFLDLFAFRQRLFTTLPP